MQFFKKNKLLFVLLFFVETLFAQQFPSVNYSTLDGLPNNSVYAVYKDSRSILWVGTANGLSAIKNNNIQNFYTTNGLAHNSCWAIAEDKNHNLWFGSYGGGLTFYDGRKFKIISTKNGLVNDKIRTLFIYQNHLFVGTQYGFSVVAIASGKVIYNDKIKGKKNLFQVMDFYLHNGKVHFATFSDGIWSIDVSKKKMKIENYEIPSVFSVYPNNSKLYISHIDVKNIYFNQLTIKDYYHKPIKNFATKTIFWDYTKDKRDNIYAAADGINLASGGVYQISENGLVEKNNAFGIESTKIWSLNYNEKQDLLYVGTLDKGLYIVDLKSQLLHYPPSYFKKEKLEVLKIANLNSLQLVMGKDDLFFLKANKIESKITRQQLYNFMLGFKLNKNIKWNSALNLYYKKVPFKNFELKDVKVIQAKIWLNTNLGLFEISKNSNPNSYYPIATKEFYFINKDKLIYQEPYGYFWTITNFTKQYQYQYNDADKKSGLRDGVQIIDLLGKQFILSTSLGLYSYQNNTFLSYAGKGLWNEKELLCGTINHKNNLAVATSTGDVFIVNVAKTFKILKKIPASKLMGRSIFFLKAYKDYLIIGNEKGIILYKDDEIRLINEEQGLTNKIFSSAHLQGEMLSIGTSTG